MKTNGVADWLKSVFLGRARDLSDRNLFHHLSLVAVLAWVGLGADGLSSSCYGPEETYRALGAHPSLSVFVAAACVGTIFVLCASYRQIIELFPSGGGGYLVASKLLSPAAGVVSGSALLVDYVLTITISVASGADALFSALPAAWLPWKLPFAVAGVAVLTVLNLRGVRESVLLWVPVFFLFVVTHGVAILVAVGSHAGDLPGVAGRVAMDVGAARDELGWAGLFLLLLRAYSLGAGTYTGIEAVSNGLPILREPRVETGKRTMTYMGVSLAVTVFGLLLAYLLYGVQPVEGKTLNAVLFENLVAPWPPMLGRVFVWLSLGSATALLFIAAQAGFLDGPRVLANMALDRWFPARFATLSDRFVARNGILLMGAAALVALLATGGSVSVLVVLYSINVFLTFALSQAGMVRHGWRHRHGVPGGRRRLAVSVVGLASTTFILASLCVVKFHEGGWVTLLVTGAVVALAFLVHRHYGAAAVELRRLNELVGGMDADLGATAGVGAGVEAGVEAGGKLGAGPMTRTGGRATPGRTAVVLVNGYNGLGLHTFLGIPRLFPGLFGHFVFVQVGVVDAGSFKGVEELERLKRETAEGVERYVALARRHGFTAESAWEVSHDVVGTVDAMAPALLERHPGAVLFGGQLAFARETVWTRWLHNHAVFALQRLFCRRGVPFVIVPARV